MGSQDKWETMSEDFKLAEDGPPFVLVAHDVEGLWDVYATRFDIPVATFTRRQQACNYASELARTRRDCLVLLRENKPIAAGKCGNPARSRNNLVDGVLRRSELR